MAPARQLLARARHRQHEGHVGIEEVAPAHHVLHVAGCERRDELLV
jgi:hypothetical protein